MDLLISAIEKEDLYGISGENLYKRIYNELVSNIEKYFYPQELTDDMDKTIKNYMNSIKEPLIDNRFIMWAIYYKRIDILLFVVREKSTIFGVIETLLKYVSDPIFMENFSTILDKNDIKKLTITTRIDILVRIPNHIIFNIDLINVYFMYLDKLNFDVRDLIRALDIVKLSKNEDLLNYILSNVFQLKEEGYKIEELESIIKVYSNKEKI